MAFQKVFIVSLIAIISLTTATEVQQCKGGPRKLTTNEVSISNCEKPVCILPRRSTAQIVVRFTPKNDIKDLITSVQGKILDVPLPFVGVDGTSACDNVYAKDGKTKVNCPLKAGEEYVYKNSFKILEIYPTVHVVVHWALKEGNNDIICFEVPSKIK